MRNAILALVCLLCVTACMGQSSLSAMEDAVSTIESSKDLFAACLKSAEDGDSNSMVKIAFCYGRGSIVERDLTAAFGWLEKASMAGNSNGMRCMALFLKDGLGVEKNESEAIVWFEKAATTGNAEAMEMLGEYYENDATDKDIKRAAVWYERAAEAGNTSAMPPTMRTWIQRC